MKLFTFLTAILTTLILQAQSPYIQWQKSLGGSSDDRVFSIQQTGDGGYIVAGHSWSTDGQVTGNHGLSDYWIVKLNAVGDTIWQKSLGGSGEDKATSIQQTSDGGYIVAGYSYSTNGNVTGHHGTTNYPDYWIVKLNSVGTILWQKSLGGSGEDNATSIQQTSDGGYIVSGYSYSTDGDVTGNLGESDYWIVKLNSIGNISWQKSLGGSSYDQAYSIQQTSDGGYIVAGYSSSTNGDVTGNIGYYDYWIVKLNAVGDTIWQKSLGGSNHDFAYSIQQTSDGGYIVAGYSYSSDGDVTGHHYSSGYSDCWIVKLNSVGDTIWQKSLGGNVDDYAYSIRQTSDGGYIVAGGSRSNSGDVTGSHGAGDYWIVKLNSIGDISWQKSLGGSDDDGASSIQQTSDGGYIVAGSSSSTNGDVTGNIGYYDYWIVKLPMLFGVNASIYPSGTGTIAGLSSPYSFGQSDTLIATPASHYTFTNWTENGNVVSTSPSYSFTVSSDRTLVANFSPELYTVTTTVNPANYGTTIGAGTYIYNDSVTVIATPSLPCYAFTNWTKNGVIVSSNSTYSFTATSNIDLIANFEPVLFANSICYVEFDTISQKNKILWDTPPSETDSIYIYSEVSTNNYTLIGKVPAMQTYFLDMGSNPQNMSNSYKISVKDICGFEGALSDNHKTITLLSAYDQPTNTYGFTWSDYEGLPVANYMLYGITSSGAVIQIGSVPGNTYFYNYPNPAAMFVKYFVGFNAPNCNAKADHLVRSNYVASMTVGIEETESSHFVIYPNPVTNELIIETANNSANVSFDILNAVGQKIYSGSVTEKTIVPTTDFAPGVYVIKLDNGRIIEFKKIVKE